MSDSTALQKLDKLNPFAALDELLRTQPDLIMEQIARESPFRHLFLRHREREELERVAKSLGVTETHFCHDCHEYFVPAKPVGSRRVFVLRCEECQRKIDGGICTSTVTFTMRRWSK